MWIHEIWMLFQVQNDLEDPNFTKLLFLLPTEISKLFKIHDEFSVKIKLFNLKSPFFLDVEISENDKKLILTFFAS